MPRYIIKLTGKEGDFYMEWSTIVDAPVTYGMSLEAFKEHIKEEYGNQGLGELPRRLERVEQYGSSSIARESAADIVRQNRAGPNERSLRLHEVYLAYCLRTPIRGGWLPE